MNVINIQYYKTTVGEFVMGSFEGELCLFDYRYRVKRTTIDNRLLKGLNADFIEKDDYILQQTRAQIDEYLGGKRKEFTIPILMVGSDFQMSVWSALLEIPYGQTWSYLQLADKLGNKKAVRAVANANGANAMSIIIPCHRIIGSDGGLGGYAGGLKSKERLLNHENPNFTTRGQQKLQI